jgi:hypothetical protein
MKRIRKPHHLRPSCINLTHELYAKLLGLAKQTNLPQGEIVRRLLSLDVQKQLAEWNELEGRRKHDELLQAQVKAWEAIQKTLEERKQLLNT